MNFSKKKKKKTPRHILSLVINKKCESRKFIAGIPRRYLVACIKTENHFANLRQPTNRRHFKYGSITERSKFNFDLWLTAPIYRYRFARLHFDDFGPRWRAAATLFRGRLSRSRFIRTMLDSPCVTLLLLPFQLLATDKLLGHYFVVIDLSITKGQSYHLAF